MIIADNRAYDYYDYSDEQFIYDEMPLSDKKEKAVKKKAVKKKSRPHIFIVMLIFSISIAMIARYAYIAEINFNINKLEKELKELEKENSMLGVKLAQKINLQSLENIAFEELNMQYPDLDQIVYVNVEKPIQKNETVDKTYFSKEDVFENKYISKIKSIIGILVSFLD